ncbi:HAD family phosphatase [Pseudomonas cavernae]|uniref:HAD family phosphatase n=1 Tax=Pseudomonas cavernae TaxID=2320867 RepID=A0A385Z3C9_9PSED|nr:HAD family phosphatase [Pseudomonas cavernae]AYC33161.1 HAD family phosphatase [Pseudomonas cavernae]
MPPPSPPAFTAVLFGLSGCLVDFGARTLASAQQRLGLADHVAYPVLPAATRNILQPMLLEAADRHAQPCPGSLALLEQLQQQTVPCAWLEELPAAACDVLASALPAWLQGAPCGDSSRPWPAPDSCWQALSTLQVARLEGCVLISGEPRLLHAGLNAGLWTVGLAASGPLCGHAPQDWQGLSSERREQLRAQATLQLYRLGVHSVVDHLAELGPSLNDLANRRQKGEKP